MENNTNKTTFTISTDQILSTLLEQVEPIDFVALVYPESKKLLKQLSKQNSDNEHANNAVEKLSKFKINERDYVIFSIENIKKLAEKNDWGLCRNQNYIYVYNGEYWSQLDKDLFQKFLCRASERMGVPIRSSKYFQFGEKLFRQFTMQAYLPTPENEPNIVLINLLNGTYEIKNGKGQLRKFDRKDFLTYQLPFIYDPLATAPMFNTYLQRVQPDVSCQKVLSEFIGYVFIKTGNKLMKEEKALLLYGSGANGKSVFFSIIDSMLGDENVTHHSLQDITNENGYYRAQLANKLVNYSSEINGKLDSAIFKQIVSGEPVNARLPYGEPFQLKQYARLIFNCNELPKGGEITNAYFRRFLIIPFDVTIPQEEQDKNLHNKIIDKELSGVFNWVLQGLDRLLEQRKFSECDAAEKALDEYKQQSDSVRQFLNEEGYIADTKERITIPILYNQYSDFCMMNGFNRVNNGNFKNRLKSCGILVELRNVGYVAFLKKISN